MCRYAKQRDANEAEIVTALESIGCTVHRLDTPVDLLVGYRARNFLIEVKNPETDYGKNDRSTDTQRDFFATWKGQVRKVKTIEEAIDVVTRSYTQSTRRRDRDGG